MFRMLVVLCCLCGTLLGTEYIVDVNGTGDYTTIQAAINAASEGDEIEVYPGTYNVTSPVDFSGKSLWLHSRDGAATTKIWMGTPSDSDDACVVKIADEEDSPTLEGFTLWGGGGFKVGTKHRGGGIYVDGSDPEIIDCVIESNKADDGAGIYIRETPSTTRAEVQGCVIRQNIRLSSEDAEEPYAIYVYSSAVTVADCDIGVSDGDNYGGGIYGYSSDLTIEDSTIEDNQGHGIAIESSNSKTVSISRCLIQYNSIDGDDIGATAHGGGIYLNSASPTISRCIIRWNYIAPASFLDANGAGI